MKATVLAIPDVLLLSGQAVSHGLKATPARSTLADALNLRDWRIYGQYLQRLRKEGLQP